MKVIITNAFSINMLPPEGAKVEFTPLAVPAVQMAMIKWGYHSSIGHANTAAVVSDILGMTVPANRKSITLDNDTIVIVAQYSGPRLEEGAKSLPPGAVIKFWGVYLV